MTAERVCENISLLLFSDSNLILVFKYWMQCVIAFPPPYVFNVYLLNYISGNKESISIHLIRLKLKRVATLKQNT